MAFVKYVGDADEVVTPANGGIPVQRGEVVELDDLAAAGLVGYGDSIWNYVPDPAAKKAKPAPTVDAAPAEEN